MTDGLTQDSSRRSLMIKGALAMVAVVTAVAVVGATACDTVARISIPDRDFREIRTVSVMPAGDQCGQFGEMNQRHATVKAVFFDNNGEPIRDGQELRRLVVDIGPEQIGFESGALYTLPDVQCSGDAVCGRTASHGCDATGVDGVGDRCQSSSGVSTSGAPEYIGQKYQSQALAVGISRLGRWRGWYSGDFNNVYVFNEDGQNQSLDNQPLDGPGELAVDRSGERLNALSPYLDRSWQDLSEYVVDDGQREAHFGFWTFGESPAQVDSRLSSGMWTQDPVVARNALRDVPRTERGRSDIYDSIVTVLRDGFNDPSVSDAEKKSLVFIVAGHDERKRSTVDDVITEAQSLGVEVSIIQVDADRDPDLLRDDWVYYENEAPCQSDSDCANFESCRAPIRYTESSDTNDPDDIFRPRQDQLGDSFCLPDHDENGRLGPIADYQRLACETGGSYTYVPEAGRDALHHPLEAIVFESEGAWQFDISIDDFDRIDPADQGTGQVEAHLLETVLDVTISGRSQSDGWVRDDSGDTRRVFFAPVEPESPQE